HPRRGSRGDALAAHRRGPVRRHVPAHRARRGDRAPAPRLTPHRPAAGTFPSPRPARRRPGTVDPDPRFRRSPMTPPPQSQLRDVPRTVSPAPRGHVVSLSQTFAVHPEELWSALTIGSHLEVWFGRARGEVVEGG